MWAGALLVLWWNNFIAFWFSIFQPLIKKKENEKYFRLVERVIYFIIRSYILFLLLFIYALDNPFLLFFLYSLPLPVFSWPIRNVCRDSRAKSRGSGARLLGFKSYLCQLLAGWPQAGYFTSLSLLFHSKNVAGDVTRTYLMGLFEDLMNLYRWSTWCLVL